MKNFQETLDYLYSLRNLGSKYGTLAMQKLCDKINNPQRFFPSIHIAGTNGKGSVCAMLDEIFSYSGYKTGMMSSPHLVSLTERIRVSGNQISQEELFEIAKFLIEKREQIILEDKEIRPSFFELITAAGFLKFARQKVDIALIETGLGGRLDASNVLKPRLSVITNISLDHEEFLGNTIEKIAFEKAGIIKQNTPVVLGQMCKEAMDIIIEEARKKNSPVYKVEDYFSSPENYPKTNLFGSYQRQNAALAYLCAKLLSTSGYSNINEQRINAALNSVTWQGRWQEVNMEFLSENSLQNNEKNCPSQKVLKKIILDSSHNKDGAKVLEENLQLFTKQNKDIAMILASTNKLRAKSLIEIALKYAKKIYLIQIDMPSAMKVESFLDFVDKKDLSKVQISKLSDIFENGICHIKENSIVCTGSIYNLGSIFSILNINTSLQSNQNNSTENDLFCFQEHR